MAHKDKQQLNIAENEKKEALLQQKQEKKNAKHMRSGRG